MWCIINELMKVCVIDDSRSFTVLLSKLLETEGHRVVTANGGRTGLFLLENNKYDATILDISMPEFSGIDVVDALNKSGRIKEQNILVLTASSLSDEELYKLKTKGVKGILKKPLELDSLVETLEALKEAGGVYAKTHNLSYEEKFLTEMISCKSCGEKNLGNSNFCNKCGIVLGQITPKN